MLIFMVAETKREVLVVKTTIHDIMNQMIRVIELSCLEIRPPGMHALCFLI